MPTPTIDESWLLANIPLLLGTDIGVPGQDESYLRGHAARLAYSAQLIGEYIRPNDRVLDIGGGVGYIGTILKQCRDVPFDYRLYEADGVQSNRYPVTNGDFDGQPLRVESEAFDAVILLEVLEHLINDPYLLIVEISRILKPRGLLLISTPNVASVAAAMAVMRGRSPLWNPIRKDIYGRHNKEYTIADLHSFAASGGFDILREEALTDRLPFYQRVFATLLALSRVTPLPKRLLGPQYYGVWQKARTPNADPPWDIYYRDDYVRHNGS
jgi:SAM-dependent methyltransferase